MPTRESVNYVPADDQMMYPGEDVADVNAYEAFGTRLSENLPLSLGYFADDEIERRRQRGLPLPPSTLWVASNMRRPFALVSNAIASMRTLRGGHLGAKVQRHLGRERFAGLRLMTTGSIPQGGFSSSSAVTVAVKNAINALFDLGIPPDLLVHLASQAEYGTGVRAGSLDQATEQKGQAGRGTLISSNPADNYRILGTYPVPTERFVIIFPYSVERDRQAWRWSWGAYAEAVVEGGRLTAGEFRKMTGKAAEIAAILTHLPLDTSFFNLIEKDLLATGTLGRESRALICQTLRQLPLLIGREALREQLMAHRGWYAGQLRENQHLDSAAANARAAATIESFFAGWREPRLRRGDAEETGVPLRAMVAYLFGEVAKNFRLIHHPEQWIACVTLSQRGDCCADIDPGRLPTRGELEQELNWERGTAGPQRLDLWMLRCGARPFDYNLGLDDAILSPEDPPDFAALAGSNFFRGLALIDLGEAMLKRAFGADAVAVRVNAAGQGDYFQVHVDRRLADPQDVKRFLRAAFYRRFGLSPSPEFVELYPGGGATALWLSRYDSLPALIGRLRSGGAPQTG